MPHRNEISASDSTTTVSFPMGDSTNSTALNLTASSESRLLQISSQERIFHCYRFPLHLHGHEIIFLPIAKPFQMTPVGALQLPCDYNNGFLRQDDCNGIEYVLHRGSTEVHLACLCHTVRYSHADRQQRPGIPPNRLSQVHSNYTVPV